MANFVTRVSFLYRLKVAFFYFFVFLIGYGFPNRFPLFAPHHVPTTLFDDWAGFRPWTIWIYISDYLLIFTPLLFVNELSELKRFSRCVLANFVIHFPFFLFFPTTVPHVQVAGDSFSEKFVLLHHKIDEPLNCFPSQHVSLSYLMAILFWKTNRKVSILFFIWATLISISTMTTKQHYFWDVIGGIGVTMLSYIIGHRKQQSLL